MNDDDWDPEVESLLEYTRRKLEERASEFRKKRRAATVLTTSQLSNDDLLGYGFPLPVSDPEMLRSLLRMIGNVGHVEDHISALRALAIWLEEEADRLQARDPINFQISSELH
ncbi:MAG TPA: hypothetical protein VEC35_14260 [Noviherbaspirillum sp.]|nr:hypothetical protein [Noviherbaspirillum sp.]